MALSDAEYVELQSILQSLEPRLSDLYASARSFVSDQIEREKEYGQDIRVSPKQWKWLRDLRNEFAPQVRPPMQGRVAQGMSDEEIQEGEYIGDMDDEIPF